MKIKAYFAIHDELIFEVKDDLCENFVKKLEILWKI